MLLISTQVLRIYYVLSEFSKFGPNDEKIINSKSNKTLLVIEELLYCSKELLVRLHSRKKSRYLLRISVAQC
jgi:hypothetical protein